MTLKTETANYSMWWKHLIAGGVAGAVSRTFTAPIDRLKVFLQVRGTEFAGLNVVMKHMVNEGGLLSLWRGNAMNILKIAPESAIKFMAYDEVKLFIRGGEEREMYIYERFIAGSIAGGFAQTVIYPMEVLKTRLCLRESGQYKGMADLTRKMWIIEGPRSFYRGYLANCIGIVPYAGTDLAVYETLKNLYRLEYKKDPDIIALLTCGTISTTCGQVVSYPLALVRTRLQANIDKRNFTMTGLFRHILATEGFFGLYRGIVPNFIKAAPAVSITYVVYEHTRKLLGASMS